MTLAALVMPLAASPAVAVKAPGLHYQIDASLDPKRHRLDGRAVIVYRSGADTSLTALYLHAYPNAFSSPHTVYARERERQGENYDLRYAKPGELGWMTLDSATADGSPARVRMDETIAAVLLPRPLRPGDSVRIALHFRVQVPKHFDRFGHTGNAYSGAQWYPKMVVYDDQGWHLDPFHYMAEFYGDYGTFDVTLHVPDDYWVGATGVLTRASGGDNEIPLQGRDVPRDSVRVTIRTVTADTLAGKWPAQALRLETDLFAGGSEPARGVVPRGGDVVLHVPRGAPVHYSYVWDEGRTERDEADIEGRARPLRLITASHDMAIVDTLRALAAVAGDKDTLLPSLKTLRFHAERVHDFAWVASPDYVRGDTTWSGIAIRSLSFRDDQEKWADSKRFVVDVMKHHTDAVGPYVWPQFTTTEAWCGGGAMEYPMLIMNEPDLAGGLYQYLDDVIAHELGHQWFYGMLGSDERTNAWMDEGFTQWLEDEYVDKKYPRGIFRLADRVPWLTPKSAFTADELSSLSRAWARDERPMSTPAEQFASYRDYDAASYSKTVMMLHTLRGTIGEPAFDRFLHRYYRENLLRHPRPNDVLRAAQQIVGRDLSVVGRDLSGFYHKWVETIDWPGFAIDQTNTHRDGNVWRSTVGVRRNGPMTPPVMVEARFSDGSRQTKRVREDGHAAEFESSTRLTGALLDSRHDVVELNRLDNGTGLIPRMRWRPLFDFPQTDEISVLYGPTVWHGRDEGMRLGGWLEGRYLPMRDFPRGLLGFEAGANVGTRSDAVAWRAGWWRRMGDLGARGQLRTLAARDEGLVRAGLTIGNMATAPGRLHPWRTWWLSAQYRDRRDLVPVDPRHWSPGRTLNGAAGILVETVGPRREYRLELELRRGASAFRESDDPAPDANYDWARFSARRKTELFSGALKLAMRGFAGSAWRRVPRELLFDIAEASRLDALERFYENDRGPLRASGHYLSDGGGGMRGYAGRAGLGQRIASLNVDATHAATGVFAFGDLGRAEASGLGESTHPSANPLLGRTLADAGAGYAYGPVRLTAPFWVSRPEPGETPWKVRWYVSLDLAGLHPWW
jgi:hypothetical protein